MPFRPFVWGCALALITSTGFQAHAQDGNADDDARIRALEQRVLELEDALRDAEGASAAPSSGDAGEPASAQAQDVGQDVTVTAGTEGGYNYDRAMFGPLSPLQSADGRFKTFLFGQLQYDVAAYKQDDRLARVIQERDEVFSGDLSGGTKMRRVNFGIASIIEDDWIVFLSYALADTGDEVDSGLRAAAVVYRGIQPWWLMAGQFGNSVGLEASTFNQYTSMIERPMIANAFAYAPGAPLTAVIAAHRGQMTYARAGIFGKHTKVDGDYDEGWGLHGRFLLQPHKERRLSSHIGVSGLWRKPEEEVVQPGMGYNYAKNGYDVGCGDGSIGNSLRFNAFGSSAVDGTSIVDTGKFCDVEDYRYLAVEGVYARGPASIQGEWGQARVNTKSDGSYTFSGGHVDVGYFLTGESRNYNAYFGQYWRLKPNNDLGDGGLGAVELRARWQTIDLNDRIDTQTVDGTEILTGANGGEASGLTLGLHWYFNAFTRAMFNASQITVERMARDDVGTYQWYETDIEEYVARIEIAF